MYNLIKYLPFSAVVLKRIAKDGYICYQQYFNNLELQRLFCVQRGCTIGVQLKIVGRPTEWVWAAQVFNCTMKNGGFGTGNCTGSIPGPGTSKFKRSEF